MLVELLIIALLMILVIIIVRGLTPEYEWLARIVCVVMFLIWVIRNFGGLVS